jgi:hypothetical protein
MTLENNTKIPVMALVVTCVHFNEINLPAVFELRAAGWCVDITHVDLGHDALCIALDVRKLFPDDSPGIHPGDKVFDEAWKWLSALTDKYDGFCDGMHAFKNPRAKDWKFCYWEGDTNERR